MRTFTMATVKLAAKGAVAFAIPVVILTVAPGATVVAGVAVLLVAAQLCRD